MEVLVVMTIVVILMSMLFPAFELAIMKGNYARWQGIKRSIICDPDCIFYTTFQEGHGNKAKNLALGDPGNSSYDPRKLDGTISGGEWRISGGRFPGKTCLRFDGDQDWVNCSNYRGAQPGMGNFSILAWVRKPDGDWTPEGFIVVHGNRAWSTDIHYALCAGLFIRCGYLKLCDGTNDVEVGERPADGGTDLNGDTDWHFFVVVVDREEGTGYTYLDGEEETYADISSVTGTLNSPSNELDYGLKIGTYQTGSYSWNGDIDEVAVFKRALTPQEISLFYKIGKPY